MEKFTLNEAFDKMYLIAQEANLEEDIQSLREDTENAEQFMDSLKILQEALLYEWKPGDYPDARPHDGGEGEEDNKPKPDNKPGDKPKGNNLDDNETKIETSRIGEILKLYDNMYKRAEERVINDRSKANDTSYQPVPQYSEVTKVTDMKFPQNLIFFITSLIRWIKNNIINFIDKFSNIVRTLIGLEGNKTKFTKDDLKLKLQKAKQIETKYVFNDKDAYKIDRSYTDVLTGVPGKFMAAAKPVSMFTIDAADVKMLGEGLNILDGEAEVLTEDPTDVKVIRIDTSRDIFALKQSLEHFFDLFDNAYGSNDEKLFSIDDLELMLQLFKNTLDALKPNTGRPLALEIRGELSINDDAINAGRIKDNLLRTKINTDNLKAAYVVTNKQINQLAQIIMNKNLLGVSQMGVNYAYLSASTYEVMIDIIEVIDERIKQAAKMEKKLHNMKKSYEELVNKLDKRRTSLGNVSGITYTTMLQKRINDLYDAARYMTTTVQLRMNTLALYISELNDTRAILKNLNAIPEANFKDKFKSLSNKVKNIFED